MKLIITRFSIPGLLTNTHYEMHNEARLAHKFNVFEKVTKPSVLTQTDEDFQWHIFAGEFLKGKLQCEDTRMVLHYVTAKDFHKKCSEIATGITSIRLDDDDGISPFLLERLDRYSEGVISFPRGRQFKVQDGDIVFSDIPTVQPNVSAGMARINGDIHECGNHALVPTKYNVVYDDLEDAYYQCCSEFCYTNRTLFYANYVERMQQKENEKKLREENYSGGADGN